MDAAVQRLQPEPVVPGSRSPARPRERRRREGEQPGEGETHFPLDSHPSPERGAHAEARSPSADGLGGTLDVTA